MTTSGPNFGTAPTVDRGGGTDGTWTSPDNMIADDDVVAVWNKPAVSAAVGPTREVSGYGTFTGVNSGDTINFVTVTVNSYVQSATRMLGFQVQLWNNTTAQIGATQTCATTTTTTNVDSFNISGVTFAQLANLKVRVIPRGSATNGQTSTGSVDYVSLTVDYTGSGTTLNADAELTTTAAFTADASLDAVLDANTTTATVAITADATVTPPGGLFVERFEVAPDGTALTALNTGFDTIAHTGTAVSDDATKAVGTYSCKMDVATGQTDIFRHNFTLGGANGFSWFGRFDAFPPAIATLAQIRSSTTVRAQVRLNTNGTITLRNSNTTNVVTSTLAFSTGQWWRLDWKLDSGTGLQHYAMYVGANLYGTTPDETASGTYNTGTADNVHWGTVSDVAGTWTVWGDYFQAVETATFPTPPAGPTTHSADAAVATTAAITPTASLTAVIDANTTTATVGITADATVTGAAAGAFTMRTSTLRGGDTLRFAAPVGPTTHNADTALTTTAAVTAAAALTFAADAAAATTAAITPTASLAAAVDAAVTATIGITVDASVTTAAVTIDGSQTVTVATTADATLTAIVDAAAATTAAITPTAALTAVIDAAHTTTAVITADAQRGLNADTAIATTAAITADATYTTGAAAASTTTIDITADAVVGPAPVTIDGSAIITAAITADAQRIATIDTATSATAAVTATAALGAAVDAAITTTAFAATASAALAAAVDTTLITNVLITADATVTAPYEPAYYSVDGSTTGTTLGSDTALASAGLGGATTMSGIM